MGTLAVYPGSFDPLTNGHVDIISRGARLFDRIVVAILVNAEKSPLFTMEERVEILREVFKDQPNVEVDTFDGLLVEYIERRHAQVIVRGQRAVDQGSLCPGRTRAGPGARSCRAAAAREGRGHGGRMTKLAARTARIST